MRTPSLQSFLSLILSIFFLSTSTAQSDFSFWSDVDENSIILSSESERGNIPLAYRVLEVDLESLKLYLKAAPMQRTEAARNNPLLISLPMPNGRMEDFEVFESPNMMPGLAKKFSYIKSFSGRSVENRTSTVRLDYSANGFHAFIHSEEGMIYIKPFATNLTDKCISYYTKDEIEEEGHSFKCGVEDSFTPSNTNKNTNTNTAEKSAGPVDILEYRLALACTGEYAQSHGGTEEALMSVFNTIVNAINGTLNREQAMNVVLVEDNDQLIYLNPVVDPFQNADQAPGLLGQNNNNCQLVIGSQNFDIGHVFTNYCDDGIGGIAALGSACQSNKGAGVSCNGGANITNFVVNTTVHELGHQFSANHCFNNCPAQVNGGTQENSGTAWEPGSGSTIMSYSGSCGAQNLSNVSTSQDYYNAGNLAEMYFFTHSAGGSECVNLVESGNTLPELNIPIIGGFYIPISTPFELTCEASDADGDELTYTWEQQDIGPLVNLGSPVFNAPSFRSMPPNSSPTRVFPGLNYVVNNNSWNEEVLPTYDRDFTFKACVRDNNPEIGGLLWEELAFKATESAGPFLVTYPNANDVVWEGGDYVEVTWDVANTTNSLVNCQYVDIYYSNDGGYTYPILLAQGAPNNGSQFIVVPNEITTTARIKIKGSNNVFFDISNNNIEIVPPSTPGYSWAVSPFSQQVCLPDAAVIELETNSLLGFNEMVTFEVISGLPTGATVNYSANPTSPENGSSLTIDIPETTPAGNFTIEIMGTAENTDAIFRTVELSVVNNDFSTFAISSPANGSLGMIQTPTFTWTPLANADYYEIEVSDNPAFGDFSIISSTSTNNELVTNILLNATTLYYWRVRPINVCGAGPYSEIFTFQTLLLSCNEFEGESLPLNIQQGAGSTTEVIIGVPISGEISDLIIPAISLNFSPVNAIKMTLVSPEGTQAILYDGSCGNSSLIQIGFNDNAPLDVECPPSGNIIYKPLEPLSIFNGEDSEGEWKLKVKVIESGFGNGSVNAFDLQMCANFTAQQIPYLINNETRGVPTGGERIITNEFLLTGDDNNQAQELKYTIVTAPSNGTLYRNGNLMDVGSIFSQATINVGNLNFVHDGSTAMTDHFTFTVNDGEGGWINTTQFNIEVDPNAPVGVDDLEEEGNFVLFPNPTTESVNLIFEEAVSGQLEVRFINVAGQIIAAHSFTNPNQQLNFATSNFAAGVYFVNVQTDTQTFTKKLLVQ